MGAVVSQFIWELFFHKLKVSALAPVRTLKRASTPHQPYSSLHCMHFLPLGAGFCDWCSAAARLKAVLDHWRVRGGGGFKAQKWG